VLVPVGADTGPVVKVETRYDGEEEHMVGCRQGLAGVGTGPSRQPGPVGAGTKFP
jgi:hypothetical protein